MNEIKREIQEEIRKEFQKDWEKEKKKNPDCDSDTWWEERRLGMKIFLGFLIGIGIIALIFLCGLAVKLLWNWLMPEIFGLKEITYWQAWGLFALSSILFKSFPSGGGDDGGKRGDRRRRKELRRLMDEEVIKPADSDADRHDADRHDADRHDADADTNTDADGNGNPEEEGSAPSGEEDPTPPETDKD